MKTGIYLRTYECIYSFPFSYLNERNMEHRKLVVFYQIYNTSNENGKSLFFIIMEHYRNINFKHEKVLNSQIHFHNLQLILLF